MKKVFLPYLALVLMLTPTLAFAYVDPSVTSYAIQAVAGIAVAVGAFAAVYWRRAKKKMQDKLGIDADAKKAQEEDVVLYTADSKNKHDLTHSA